MWGRQGTSGHAEAPTAAPRDVETLEGVIAALGAGVSDEVAAHQRIMHSLVGSLDLAYGAAWLPDRVRSRTSPGRPPAPPSGSPSR